MFSWPCLIGLFGCLVPWALGLVPRALSSVPPCLVVSVLGGLAPCSSCFVPCTLVLSCAAPRSSRLVLRVFTLHMTVVYDGGLWRWCMTTVYRGGFVASAYDGGSMAAREG